MRFLANLFQIGSTKKGQYPGDTQGDSIIATGEGSASKGETAQVYGQHGFISNPAKGTRCVRLRIGSLDIIIAAFSYTVPAPSSPGESKVYSTDSDGNEAGKHELQTDGTHVFNDGTIDAARKGDSTKLDLTGADVAALATALLATGAFVPSGSAPIPGTPITFTGGEITDGTSEVKLP
jgi:hypothetical protein